MIINHDKSFFTALFLALLVGLIAGSWDRVDSWLNFAPKTEPLSVPFNAPRGTEDTPAAERTLPGSVALSSARPTADQVNARINESQNEVFANSGVILKPARANNTFLGYRVINAAKDNRFQAGDIIVRINGAETEDSAAGSELLIAALANPDSRIELRRGDD